MMVKFETPNGTVAYIGVADFEALSASAEADFRLHPPRHQDCGEHEVEGEFLGAVDGRDVPDAPEGIVAAEYDETHDWRSE
jgi:hypothetical protein